MKKIIIFLVSLNVLFAVSCNSQSQTTASSINKSLPVAEFQKYLFEKKDAQLIDVRTPDEYFSGHLIKAINMNYNGDDFEKEIQKLDKNKPTFVYCLSGGRSSNAAALMEKLGFKEIYNMAGGIMKWNAEGMEVEAGTTPEKLGMTIEEFGKITSTEKYVLVDFHAKWCRPCQRLKPLLADLAEKKSDKMILVKIDVDENKKLVQEKKVDALPYLELYKNGKLIWQHTGDIEIEQLIKETNL